MLDGVRRHWPLDPAVTFLNHGSFGSCPTQVMAIADALRARIEREPVRFLVADLEAKLDETRAVIAELLGAQADDLTFVPNATFGVNSVLSSLALAPGDELLTFDHAYNACRNVLEYAAARAGAKVVVAHVPFPTPGPSAIVEAVLAKVTPRTKLAMIDHVTSQTALVLPVARLVAELEARGVDTLVDAAHAPGMVPMALDRTGAAYTTGNFHKWICAPRGAAFLHVRRDRQDKVRPLVISHGANSPRTDRSRYLIEFDWMGTVDPTPWLCVPDAIRFLEGLMPGGLPALMERNHEMALTARRRICDALGIAPPCPDDLIGSMASLPMPAYDLPEVPGPFDPLQEALFTRFGIEIPVFPFANLKILRVSTPAYIGPAEIERLVEALAALGIR
jgi:isopenicillin-N epimerase